MTSSRPARGYVLPPYGKATPRGRIVLDRHVEAAKIVGQPITKAVLPHPEASNFHLRACACNWLDRHVAGPRPVRNGHQRLLRQRKLGRDRAHSDRLTAADTRAGNLSNACRAQGLLSALQVRICGAHLVLRQGACPCLCSCAGAQRQQSGRALQSQPSHAKEVAALLAAPGWAAERHLPPRNRECPPVPTSPRRLCARAACAFRQLEALSKWSTLGAGLRCGASGRRGIPSVQ